MKVWELKDMLDDFDEDDEIVIGMYQRYGSNFAMEIDEVNDYGINYFYGEDKEHVVVLTQGNQIGTVDYSNSDYCY